MLMHPISREEFDTMNPVRHPETEMFTQETAWFRNSARTVLGSVVYDRTDKDWAYVILGNAGDGFRWTEGDSSLASENEAIESLLRAMEKLDAKESAREDLYVPDDNAAAIEEARIVFTDINEELKRYLAKHPEKLYDLTPRKFEELIASILKDFGLDVKLTPATRDGGRDIIAYIRNAVCRILLFVECKKWSPKNKVGVQVVDRLIGVSHIYKANKSLLVTTSTFTKDAIEHARLAEEEIELKDYEKIKAWLQQRLQS